MGDSPLSAASVEEAMTMLSAAYRLDYFDPELPEHATVGLLVSMATEEGYGDREFIARLKAMVKACKFPTWTPADFFADRVKLHPYGWYLDRVTESKANASQIDCYTLADGSHGWGWKHEVRDMLPLYRPDEKPAAKELPDHAEPMPYDVAAQLKEFVKDVDVKLVERADMEATIARLRSELFKAQGDRDFWKDAATALQLVVSEVIDGTLTVEALRDRVTSEEEPTNEKEAA